MYFGLQTISDFTFVSIGFLFVATGAMGFVTTFFLGSSKGGRTALAFSRIWAVWVILSLIGTIIYAIASGQWTLFLRVFGWGPLIEMSVLAFGWIAIFWFMATQYAIGRINLDEKFFGSKERREEIIEEAKRAQREVYRRAKEEQEAIRAKKAIDEELE